MFLVFSSFRNVKLHWTVPVWLGAVPLLAAAIVRARRGLVRALWPPTITAALLIYGAGFHYLSLGFPGVPYAGETLGVGMQDLARQVEHIVVRLARQDQTRADPEADQRVRLEEFHLLRLLGVPGIPVAQSVPQQAGKDGNQLPHQNGLGLLHHLLPEAVLGGRAAAGARHEENAERE